MDESGLVVGELPAGSLLWDVGAFEGEWARDMVRRNPGVLVECFEPVPGFAAGIQVSPGMVVKEYGLGPREESREVRVAGDASSAWGSRIGVETGRVACRFRAVDVEFAGRSVAVMKLNVEGAEYDILEAMVAADVMRQVGVLLVQFHAFVTEAERRKARVVEYLAGTHVRRWSIPWTWERWDLCRCQAP